MAAEHAGSVVVVVEYALRALLSAPKAVEVSLGEVVIHDQVAVETDLVSPLLHLEAEIQLVVTGVSDQAFVTSVDELPAERHIAALQGIRRRHAIEAAVMEVDETTIPPELPHFFRAHLGLFPHQGVHEAIAATEGAQPRIAEVPLNALDPIR